MVESARKVCTKCKIDKNLDEFGYKSAARDGREYRCKPCRSEDGRLYHKTVSQTASYKQRMRENFLKSRYGLSYEEYKNLYESQNKVCKICELPLEIVTQTGNTSTAAQVDHDHITGRVRGLLCTPCNVGLGGFKDSVTLLQRAFQYLIETESVCKWQT